MVVGVLASYDTRERLSISFRKSKRSFFRTYSPWIAFKIVLS